MVSIFSGTIGYTEAITRKYLQAPATPSVFTSFKSRSFLLTSESITECVEKADTKSNKNFNKKTKASLWFHSVDLQTRNYSIDKINIEPKRWVIRLVPALLICRIAAVLGSMTASSDSLQIVIFDHQRHLRITISFSGFCLLYFRVFPHRMVGWDLWLIFFLRIRLKSDPLSIFR